MGTQPHGNWFYADVAYFFKTLLPRSGFQVPVVQGFSVWVVLAFWVSRNCLGFPEPPCSDLLHVTALPHLGQHHARWTTRQAGKLRQEVTLAALTRPVIRVHRFDPNHTSNTESVCTVQPV